MGKKYEGLLYPAHKDILAIETLSQDIDQHLSLIHILIEESKAQLAAITSKLKSQRKAKGFSLFDIAAECECYHTQIADIEKNTIVILNVFVRYANAMGSDLVLKKSKQ